MREVPSSILGMPLYLFSNFFFPPRAISSTKKINTKTQTQTQNSSSRADYSHDHIFYITPLIHYLILSSLFLSLTSLQFSVFTNGHKHSLHNLPHTPFPLLSFTHTKTHFPPLPHRQTHPPSSHPLPSHLRRVRPRKDRRARLPNLPPHSRRSQDLGRLPPR